MHIKHYNQDIFEFQCWANEWYWNGISILLFWKWTGLELCQLVKNQNGISADCYVTVLYLDFLAVTPDRVESQSQALGWIKTVQWLPIINYHRRSLIDCLSRCGENCKVSAPINGDLIIHQTVWFESWDLIGKRGVGWEASIPP